MFIDRRHPTAHNVSYDVRLLAVPWAILAEWSLRMTTDNISSVDLDSAVARFRTVGSVATSAEALLLPNWGDDDWRQLFRFTSIRKVPAGEALIRRGEPDRTLYFVLDGELEVIAHSVDGLSLGHVAVVSTGSVLGEQAFFDGKPRSAGAWAVDDCKVAALSPEQYVAFEGRSPARARDLLFALGRILAMRLRRTTAKVIG